ncbi:AMP-dependent synthetase/ligase [Corynebacterium callunae]|uniref:AMP-dependent synthetase/ligase n=1 Tax=Corynebacterium callunae TaxID=1721 RepID=UPI001FFF4018|nr:long-chain fatty acid--CoA ligase [Corynebacterium callunae]MCK2199313.1 long-chain fatty acid--CoA ligase [Corynebacterium callunae]
MTAQNSLQEYSEPAQYTIGESETCLTALLDQVKSRPYGVLFSKPANFEWVNVTAQEFQDEVFAVAKGIISTGVEQGARVALLANTRYEWAVLDFAIWAAGAASVPIYSSSSLSQVEWIIEDSGAVLAITETPDHTDLMKNLVLGEDGTPALKGSSSQLRRVLEINASALDTLKFEGRDLSDDLVWERIHNTKSSDLASLVYTSGTTGRPKGCILTHYNWLAEVRGLLTNPIGAIAAPGTRLLTFLPLAHVLARAVHLAFAIAGATQSHWSDFSSLTLELQRSRPNLILGVPRVFEKVRNAAASNAADGGPIKAALFARAEKTAIEYSMALDTPEGPSRSVLLSHKVFDRLIYSKIRAAVGNSVQYAITGGSAMGQELLHFFRGIGIPIYEGYGLTESAAAAAVDFEDQKIGTVGKPLGGMTIRINEVGEILLKGEMLFQGYWNNPEATAEALHDGWFNTGDLGELMDTGHLMITGRKKDLIVTAGGKNVSPGPMEDIIKAHPLISQAMIVGDGKPFVGLLVTLDPDMLKRWKLNHNIPESRSVSDIATDAALRAEVQDAINNANATVSHSEAIKKFYILDRDLTEADNELTPTLKVKRNIVVQRYADAIDHIYNR